jgi:hypothetical protein
MTPPPSPPKPVQIPKFTPNESLKSDITDSEGSDGEMKDLLSDGEMVHDTNFLSKFVQKVQRPKPLVEPPKSKGNYVPM